MFPSGVGSVSDSPGLNLSPQALGYPSSPADNPISPLGSHAEAPSSPSPIARKRRWKGRFDLIEEATSAIRSPEASEDSTESEAEQTQGAAIVGLGVEAPGGGVLASPIVPSAASHKTHLTSRFRPRKCSTSLSPYTSPDPSSLHPDDKLRPPRHSHYEHDDDDTTSLFSLSAYYATPGLDSPSFNDYDERFEHQHLHVPPGSSPALGPAISFDALPRLAKSATDEPESDTFSANGTRHVRETSGRTARPLENMQTEENQSLEPHRTTTPPTSPKMSSNDVASEERDLPSLESAPLSTFSETTESSRSYSSSFSTSSISTRPTDIAPSSSCEGTSDIDFATDPNLQQETSIERTSSDAPSSHLALQGRFRSSSVIVPPSPIAADFQQDPTRHLPTSSSLGSITSTPRPYQSEHPHPTPLPLHVGTPETPITFAQHPVAVTPSFSPLPDAITEGRSTPMSSNLSALTSQQLGPTALYSYPDAGGRTGQSGGYDEYINDAGKLQEQQKEGELAISLAASEKSSQRTSQISSSNHSLASSSFVSVNLPAKIAFLKDTIVELHIDQLEATNAPSTTSAASAPLMTRHSRSVSKSSTAATPSTPSSCFEEDLYGEYGLAEFRMNVREFFVYHHAKFDSAPTLRRVTINGDESKDYISREASLSLKENGVYTVQGWEDKGKLFWKMDYLVDDRKASNGADINGEKTITPLTFSCSPFLLDPERGKKIGMFQVVKKSITPKISSSKLRPPQVTVSPKHSRNATPRDDGSKTTTLDSAPPVPPVPAGLQAQSQLLSQGPAQVVESGIAQEVLAKPKSGGVRSAFAKVLSRPSTPGRPSTPKRPRTPNKRPSTASKAIVVSEPSPADELADPFAKLAPSSFTASDWARRAANATVNRPRAASVNAKPALPSRPLDLDLNSLPSLASLANSGSRINTPETSGSLNLDPGSRDSPGLSLPAPHIPGPIVPPQQIERWLSDAQKDRPARPLRPPRTATSSNRPPVLPKRPSTATTDGRPWNRI
ncbi:hypothetical protein FS837_005822 [Tulasnella sp. UAMH 9824]|nr:hypothetical protein FS837_005822 [Tulasnella sp. UAMH 9824]